MKYRNVVKKYGRHSLGAAAAFAAVNAHAELPAAVGTAITALQTDAVALIALLYPAMIAIAGGFIIFGLVKKGLKKAT